VLPPVDVKLFPSEPISRPVPKNFHPYLAGLLPGVFLEISILLSDPDCIRRYVCRAQSVYSFGHYSLLAIALAVAYFIGTAFILFVSFIQWGLRVVQMRRFEETQIPDEVTRCWGQVASAQMESRYGIVIKGTVPAKEWSTWYDVLWVPTPLALRGDMVGMALHATGWCGLLTALLLTPALRNCYYIGFSLFMVFCGLTNDWWLARRLYDPGVNGVVRTRALLSEFRPGKTQ